MHVSRIPSPKNSRLTRAVTSDEKPQPTSIIRAGSRCLSIAWSTQASSGGYIPFRCQYSVLSSVGRAANWSGSCVANTFSHSASCSFSRQSIPGVGCGSAGHILRFMRGRASRRVSGTGE